MARSSLSLTVLALVVIIGGVASQQMLSVRGGAVTLTPENLAKAASVVSLATGSASALMPASSLNTIGMPSEPPLQNSMRRLGTSLLSFGILEYCLMFMNYSTEKSVAISTVPWIGDIVTVILMNDENRKGQPMKSEYIGLLFSLLTSYAAYTGAAYTKFVMKLNAGWLMLAGTLLKVAPAPQSGQSKTDVALQQLNKFLGSCMLSVGLFEEALAYDVGVMKSIAFGSCLFALGAILSLFVEKESEELNLPRFPRIAWLLVFGGFGLSIYLGSNNSS